MAPAARVYAVPHNGAIKVYPGEFLGPGPFAQFLRTCRAGGAAYSTTAQGHLVDLDLLPGLVAALGRDGLAVHVQPDVIAAARARADAIDRGQAVIAGRLGHESARVLYRFQQEGVRWSGQRERGLLADDMGLGKSVQSLIALDRPAAIIVAPASLKKMWSGAVARWRPDLEPLAPDAFQWPAPGQAVIVNYEMLPLTDRELAAWSKPTQPGPSLSQLLPTMPADLGLIADEVHFLKKSGAARTQRFRALRKAVAGAGGWVLGLTGTPMANGPMDLMGVLESLGLLKSSFGSFPRFVDLMNGKRDYWGGYQFADRDGNIRPPKPGALEALERVMLRRLVVDVLPDLPRASYRQIDVDIDATARAASDEARAAMAAVGVSLADVIERGASLGAAEEVVFRARRLLAEAMIPKAVQLLRDFRDAGEPVVFVSAHRAPPLALTQLGAGLIIGGQGEKAEEVVAAFQAGEIDAVAMTIKTGGIGHTLTRACNIVLIDEEWTPDWNDQAVARLVRIGQTREVIAHRLIAPGTIAEDVMAINERKRSHIKATINQTGGRAIFTDPAALRALGGP